MNAPGDACRIAYFKRFRMELPLPPALPAPLLPAEYSWTAWTEQLIEAHAEALFGSFHEELDATVFPSLGDPTGCRCLLLEISRKAGFLPGATWLVMGPAGPVGTVQGVYDRTGTGAIQNLGIVPAHRGKGLGEALLLQALHGFCAAGLGQALLEVTAQNDAAIRLYRRVGFRCRKIIYKAVEAGSLV
jgi:ribosomal protein S18 acetylase RimI-like enzyme